MPPLIIGGRAEQDQNIALRLVEGAGSRAMPHQETIGVVITTTVRSPVTASRRTNV